MFHECFEETRFLKYTLHPHWSYANSIFLEYKSRIKVGLIFHVEFHNNIYTL